MKVVMRVKATGSRDGVEWPNVGGVLDVPAAEAADLVGALLAKYADDDEPEAAVAPAAETAAMPKPRATRKPKPE